MQFVALVWYALSYIPFGRCALPRPVAPAGCVRATQSGVRRTHAAAVCAAAALLAMPAECSWPLCTPRALPPHPLAAAGEAGRIKAGSRPDKARIKPG